MKIKILLLSLVLFTACQDVNKALKPKNLIPEDKMVNLLVDLQKMDAVISKNKNYYELRKVKAKDLIFEKYQVDSMQLAESSNYYAEDFATNTRIYERVITKLEAEKKIIDSLYEERSKAMQDSKIKGKREADSL
ncbi:DUF4296 domain-containing protein [Mesonia ostreae]|uniref:DUF4296 domain-containing protein n=1 Tax=Mesonia ostreae TaxID=861110 RepID=A0ABU2KHD5_9FLAO|nr:DUF4296 domain-containing protein [Mesonia ostreae]MDT0294127.1 DUF4296 domain-containing protein [Mesonia ostreae]